MYDKVYYVGAKAEESGTIQGQALAAYWDAHPEADLNKDGVIQYVMLTGEPGHQDAELRTKYSIQYLTDNNYKVECLAQDTAMWDRVKGQDKMATFLAAHPDKIEAVFANNDDMPFLPVPSPGRAIQNLLCRIARRAIAAGFTGCLLDKRKTSAIINL